jgi:hypothetical protein
MGARRPSNCPQPCAAAIHRRPGPVAWTYTGSGNFIVDLIDPTDGSPADSVANLIGTSTDSTQLYNHAGLFALDVTADGPWKLTVTSTP